MADLEKVRVDKWLWSVRLFKSRSLSAEAVKAGRIRIGSNILKPAYMVKLKDVLEVRRDGFHYKYEVIGLIDKRVGAPLAVLCYNDLTPVEEKEKYNIWFANEMRERGAGRPTKRERRDIDGFKVGDDDYDDFDIDDDTDDDD
jgi:ribosome-associated heat shock protein Hsp15